MHKAVNYESELCGSLPIHLTNLIQPYGTLLVLDRTDLTIIQASENTERVMAKPVQEVVGTALKEYLHEDLIKDLIQKLLQEKKETIPAVWDFGNGMFVVLIHQRDEFLIAEVNIDAIHTDEQDSFVKVYQDVRYAISALEATTNIKDACALAAKELKRISGFDKVMIYSFDDDWNGHVLAEAMEPGMEKYLGFTFPASDIPKQARDLYLRNAYRLIPDRNAKPLRMYPVINPITNSFIDLSDCNLRSVTAVHIEYLGNMNVTASMSTRILHHDALWGLIACHHRTAKNITYAMTSVFEMMSSVISVKVTSLQNQRKHTLLQHLTVTQAALIESIYKSSKVDGNLLSDFGVMKIFKATGAAITRGRKFSTAGKVPSTGELEELVLWLHTKSLKKVFYSDKLSVEHESAASFAEIGSGLLVIPINASRDEYVLIFRPEIIRTINWGGNPEDRIQFEQDQRTYHPRHSFKLWQQHVNSVSRPWRPEEISTAESLRSFIYEFETSAMLKS